MASDAVFAVFAVQRSCVDSSMNCVFDGQDLVDSVEGKQDGRMSKH